MNRVSTRLKKITHGTTISVHEGKTHLKSVHVVYFMTSSIQLEDFENMQSHWSFLHFAITQENQSHGFNRGCFH